MTRTPITTKANAGSLIFPRLEFCANLVHIGQELCPLHFYGCEHEDPAAKVEDGDDDAGDEAVCESGVFTFVEVEGVADAPDQGDEEEPGGGAVEMDFGVGVEPCFAGFVGGDGGGAEAGGDEDESEGAAGGLEEAHAAHPEPDQQGADHGDGEQDKAVIGMMFNGAGSGSGAHIEGAFAAFSGFRLDVSAAEGALSGRVVHGTFLSL